MQTHSLLFSTDEVDPMVSVNFSYVVSLLQNLQECSQAILKAAFVRKTFSRFIIFGHPVHESSSYVMAKICCDFLTNSCFVYIFKIKIYKKRGT